VILHPRRSSGQFKDGAAIATTSPVIKSRTLGTEPISTSTITLEIRYTGKTPTQQWIFSSLGAINDASFSTNAAVSFQLPRHTANSS